MQEETFDKIQDLVEDLEEADSNYNSFEQDFIDGLDGMTLEDKLSDKQDSKLEEIWQRHIRRDDSNE